MSELAYLLIGIATGVVVSGVIAYLLGTARARSRNAAAIAQAQTEAKIAQKTIAQLESQIYERRTELDAERDKATKAQTQLEEAQKKFEEQKALLDHAQEKLTDTFKALSSDALKSNSQALIEMAKKSLETVIETAKGDLKTRQESIKGLVQPVQNTLKRYEEHIKSFEGKHQETHGSLKEQISNLANTEKELLKETGNLVSALRNPQTRGKWGEVTLKRVVELSGLCEHYDYITQSSVTTMEGRSRPDMVVDLPGDLQIVIDAKVPLDAYLTAMDETDPEKKGQFLVKHARHLREHVKILSGKEYWNQFDKAPEFVVMFLPYESFFSAAVECDPALIEVALEKRVVIATATTLFAVLSVVERGWRQQRMNENAKEISQLGKLLYERMRKATRHILDMGSSLDKTVNAYNKVVGSLESRVFPAARKFKELGAGEGDELPAVPEVDTVPRDMQLPDGENS